MSTEIVTVEQNAITQPVTHSADRNPALVYLASLSPSSRRTMGEALNKLAGLLSVGLTADTCPWHLLRYQHTQALRAKLAELYPSAATANRHIYALRGVLKECWRLGLMTAEDYQRAIDIKPVQGQKATQAERGRHLKMGELSALVNVCADGTPLGVRDSAVLAVAYGCGLRRAEVAAMQLADFDTVEGTITVKRGKGNKERVVPLTDDVCEYLTAWIEVRGPWAGALFTRILKGGHVTVDGMTEQAIYNLLAQRADQAGVKKFSPHDLRRTFAGDLLDNGADLSTVQKLMGHSSANTTAGYDRRDGKAKRKAVNTLHIPRKTR